MNATCSFYALQTSHKTWSGKMTITNGWAQPCRFSQNCNRDEDIHSDDLQPEVSESTIQLCLDDRTFLSYYSSHLQRRGTCADGERRSERGLRLRSRHMHSTSSHSDSRQGITNAICCQYRMDGEHDLISVTFGLSNQTNKRQNCCMNQ